MERPKNILAKYLLLLIISIMSNNIIFAQNSKVNNYREAIFKSYLSGNMEIWRKTLSEIEKDTQYQLSKGNISNLTELLNYYYGYIGYLISIKDRKEANRYIDKGEQIIEAILSKEPNNSSILSYKAAFLGFRIALSNFKAITLGIRSIKLSNRAYQIDSTCFNTVLEKANILNYSPKLVGGDKEQALNYYINALKIYKIQNREKHDWNYLSLRVTIINLLIELNDHKKAKKEVDQILDEFPNFKWVKDEISPKLENILK